MSGLQVKPSMFVVGVVFKNSFIIQNFYELLPIVPIINYNFIKGESLPYFGIDCAIVSLAPKIENNKGIITKARGIRVGNNGTKSGSNSFGNAISVDFQTNNKSYNIFVTSSKVGESKFKITGLTSYKMAEDVTYKFLNQVKITETKWRSFFILKYDDKLAFLQKMYNLINDETGMLRYGNKKLNDKLESMKEELGNLYECALLIVRYTLEDATINEFGNRIARILNLNTGMYSIFHDKDDFKIIIFDIYLGVYTGRICNGEIYLSFITSKLRDMGFSCGFCNQARTEISILIPICNEIHYNEKKTGNEQKGHLFKIKSKGSVDLYSKGNPDEALQIGNYVISTITDIINSSEYKAEMGSGNNGVIQSMYDSAIQNLMNQQNCGFHQQQHQQQFIPVNVRSTNLVNDYC